MKPPLLITLSFLLSAFTTKLPLAFSDDKQLRTTNGELITTNQVLYILPDYPSTESQAGGGLILGLTQNCSRCPLNVLQHFSSEFNGLPIIFSTPLNPNTSVTVTTSTQIDITFIHKPINCANSFKWVVLSDDEDCTDTWIGVGDEGDYPGKITLSGSFHVQRLFNGRYKLVFCRRSGVCKHIGRYNDVNGRRLILSDDNDPFLVKFVRSHDTL